MIVKKIIEANEPTPSNGEGVLFISKTGDLANRILLKRLNATSGEVELLVLFAIKSDAVSGPINIANTSDLALSTPANNGLSQLKVFTTEALAKTGGVLVGECYLKGTLTSNKLAVVMA